MGRDSIEHHAVIIATHVDDDHCDSRNDGLGPCCCISSTLLYVDRGCHPAYRHHILIHSHSSSHALLVILRVTVYTSF